MKRVRTKITESRAQTNASLIAERAHRDAPPDRTADAAQDAQIERERVAEDNQLSTLRESSDEAMARERLEAPSPSGAVAMEREADDERKLTERDATDALLCRERGGADAVVEAERRDRTPLPDELLRKDTDLQLSMERLDVDGAVATLADTEQALLDSQMADVAERERSTKVLQETERQLRHAQKMEAVGVLAGGIAHDFNNILSVILSYGEMLLGDLKPGEPMYGDVEEICKAGHRAAGLTRQLLTFSRQEVTEAKVLDLNDLLGGIDKMLQRILGASVDFVSLHTTPLGRIRIDPGSLEQVIVNLVVNARDAMPMGGKLTIETADVTLDNSYAEAHIQAKPGPHVMMAVTDTGVGMDRETQGRIFEPFFTTKPLGKGTGLGLSTVFGIVQQNGGHIWVYSEPGRGTTFKVYLPRVDGAIDVLRARTAPKSLRGTETILVVEDEEPVRAIVLSILRRQGYHVIPAQHAGEALLLCEQHPTTIHLLLTDVVMPQMSGPQLAKRLTVTRPDIKVLCMSGYTDDSIVRHGILESGTAFLQKPITPATLTTKVREVLDRTT